MKNIKKLGEISLKYIRYSENDIHQKAINEQWIGQGTPENPLIIESTHNFSDESVIRDSSLHIIVKNCTFKYLTLNKCKNLKFERCRFEVLNLLKCSNISIDDCSFKLKLSLIKSHNSLIQNSLIVLLNIASSFENHFKTCSITQIYNHFSSTNTFEAIKTPIKDFDTIMGVSSKKFFLKILGFPVAGIILLVIAIGRFINTFSSLIIWSLIEGIFLMVFIILVSTIAIFHDYKKMQRYPPNTIL